MKKSLKDILQPLSDEEGNKVIAEFMGYEKVKIGYFGTDEETDWMRKNKKWMDEVGLDNIGDFFVKIDGIKSRWFYCEDAKYHSSWDELIPVLQKIRTINYGKMVTEVPEMETELNRRITENLRMLDLKATWLAVISYIVWYNQNLKGK